MSVSIENKEKNRLRPKGESWKIIYSREEDDEMIAAAMKKRVVVQAESKLEREKKKTNYMFKEE